MDIDSFLKDTSVSKYFSSTIPKVTKEKPCMLGVDEAGRGPVLGPMVYGICFCPLSDTEKLKEMKFADSKTLKESQREILFDEIDGAASVFLGWMTEVISPNVICNKMLKRSKYNLNLVSHDSAVGLIQRALDEGVNVKEVYVDTVGDATKYEAKLSNIFPGIKVTVAKKADSTYPIVSAASICAKVCRDNILKRWNFVEKIEIEPDSWGSGYPGDPATKKFLVNQLDPVFGFPQLVRFSWSTASKILDDKAATVEWDDVEDEENTESTGTKSLLSFFKCSPAKRARKEVHVPHSFFTDRCLSQMTTF